MNSTIEFYFHCWLCLILFPSFCFSSEEKPNPPPREQAHLVILNALHVPSTRLSIGGREIYPDFRPGDKTSGGTTGTLEALYEIKDPTSGMAYSETLSLAAGSFQSLIVLGDFSLVPPQKKGLRGVNASRKSVANIAYRLLSHDAGKRTHGFRYRFLNACREKTLRCKTKGETDRDLAPGQLVEYTGKPATITFELSGPSGNMLLPIRQEKPFHNATFVVTDLGERLSYYVIAEETGINHRDTESTE